MGLIWTADREADTVAICHNTHEERMLDKFAEATGQKVTLAGAGVSTASGLWGWLGQNHEMLASIGVLVGIVVGLVGLSVQVISTRRRERREIEAHEARMARLLREDVA